MDQVKEYYQQWTEIPQPRKIKALKLVAFVCYFLFLFLLIIYAFGRTGKKTVSIVPTILFTDGTPYNLEVVRYLAQRRDVILGMIVVANNALATNQLASTTTRVAELLTLLKSDGFKTNVPAVYAGYAATDDGDNFAEPLNKYMQTRSVNFLVVGPCTDAAYLLQQYPGLRSQVKTIYVGGGAFNVAGNANYLNTTATSAERNFFMDPAAADYIVARSHTVPVVLLPLDAALKWTDAAYSAIVSSPSSASSAAAVATGLTWYYTNVDVNRRTTVGIIAAAYATDTQVQTGVSVTSIPVRVYTSDTDARYGGSYRAAGTTSSPVSVVIAVVEATFFGHCVNVNNLALA